MRKFCLAAALAAICLSVLCSCATDTSYGTAQSEVRIFDCFNEYGAHPVRAEVTAKGELTIEYRFASAPVIENAVKNLNERAVGEENYALGKRLLTVKKTEGSTAWIYVWDINALKTAQIQFMQLEYYLKKYADLNESFVNLAQKELELSSLDQRLLVLKVSGASVPVTIQGRSAAYTPNGLAQRNSNTYVYSTDAFSILFRASHLPMILTIVAVIAVVLIAVFIILIKMGIFTSVKLNHAKKQAQNKGNQ